MSATLRWRYAVGIAEPAERHSIVAEISSPDAIEEALAEVRSLASSSPEDALKVADLACEMADLVGSPKLQSAAFRSRGQALRALSRHVPAIDAFEAASRCALEAGDERLALQSRIGIVDSLGWLERFDEAIKLANELERELLSRGEVAEAGKVLANSGNLYHRRDDYPAALDAYSRALERLRGRVSPDAVARVEVNLANILTHLNRVHEATALYEQARAGFEARDDSLSAAVVDLNVGFLRYISGEHSAALAAFTRSRKTFQALGRNVEAAKVDGDMGDVYRALNLLPEALECYERAIQVFGEVGLEYETARAEIGRAVILAADRRTAEAMEALDRADAIFRVQKNQLQRAHVGLIRAHVMRSAGMGSQAAREASKAARALTRAGLHGWAAEALFIQFDVELEANRDSTEAMQGVVEQARAHLRSSLESRAHHSLGRYYERRDDVDRALEHLRLAVAALEHARTLVSIEEFHVAFLRDKLSIYEDLVAALLTRGLRHDVLEALDYVERSKSRLLLERVQTAHDAAARHGGAVEPELAARIEALRAELCRHYHGLNVFEGSEQLQRRVGVTVGSISDLQRIETDYRSALREAELASSTDDAGRLGQAVQGLGDVVGAEDLQAALAPDETMIEYASFYGQVCAFVLTRDAVAVRLSVAQVDDVQHAARRLRYHLQRVESQSRYVERHHEQMHEAIRNVLRELYQLLLAPLESLIRGRKLVIVPHGVVHGLPIHAAADGDDYALDRWEVIYAPGASVWHAAVTNSDAHDVANLATEQALLMAVPAPGIELVQEEVERLSGLFGSARVYKGDAATLSAFHEQAPRSRIIHLATHALFRADNPLFSGLAFADGWLLAHDLYRIALDCDLATLSACRTGATLVAPGDELFGLIRGFLAAGARSLAVSLWPAADAATLDVMVRFYGNLASGMGRAAALRQAQRDVREVYPHPYHWAAFALVGVR